MAGQPRIKLALVGTGSELVQAVDAFNRPSTIEIVAVVDAQDRAAGARLAERLRVAPAAEPPVPAILTGARPARGLRFLSA